jgi:hypothetical protein
MDELGVGNITPLPFGVHEPSSMRDITRLESRASRGPADIALAIVGGLAAGAAPYGASRQTYRSNYSGYVAGPRGVTSFAGTNTVPVYDPLAGILAGAAVDRRRWILSDQWPRVRASGAMAA